MPSIDLGNVMGPQGPQGTIWYQGTAITGTSTTAAVFADSGIEEARVYDKYFNTGTNDVYTCTVAGDADTAKWAWIGNLRGAQGNIGPVGPTGSVDMNTPIEFTEAETMANIESGESVSTIFGKLKKVVGNLLDGSASTLLRQKLTASRALVSDANGNVGVSGITSTELGYLDGVTGNIQGQIGDLTQLQTTDKSSIVAAVNEQNVKVRSMVSDAYNQDAQYAVGDYCIYENALYKCITEATGVWDATKWKKTAVGTELREQNVNMNKVVMSDLTTDYGKFAFYTNGKVQSVYAYLTNAPTTTDVIVIENFTEHVPKDNYVLLTVYSASSPYNPIGCMWIYTNGKAEIYKPKITQYCYIYGTYISA